MIRVLLALDADRCAELIPALADEGVDAVRIADPTGIGTGSAGEAVAVLMPATRAALTPEVIGACDRAALRIIALGDQESRLAARSGITVLPAETDAAGIAAALRSTPPTSSGPHRASRVVAVWGPHGAPGRTTVAIQLAAEFTRRGLRTALVDADTVAPSIALLLGLGDDAPGLAAACRRAELDGLDPAELSRIAVPLETDGGTIEVLGGLNRPTRWPEISHARLTAVLEACRSWVDRVVVDVSAAFDADEEVTWDLAGPRRHAATSAALGCADEVVAVASADPLGIARLLREHAELRGAVDAADVHVLVNRVRPGPLGIDARGQVRRTLDRFADIREVHFLPHDQRATDAALLHARPIADVTPRSPLAAGIRRLAATLTPEITADSSTGSSRASRSPRRARAVRAASRRGSDPEWAS